MMTLITFRLGVVDSKFAHIMHDMLFSTVQDAATKASLVGSITVGATFLLSALAGILTDRFGIR